MPEAGVCALVLAAGLGRRYRAESGEDKLLAPCDPGAASPAVLQRTLAALSGVAERVVVVIRREHPRLADAVAAWQPEAQRLLIDTDGLGTSLARAVAASPVSRGWLVTLGDMPYVRPDTYACLAAALDRRGLILPTYDGQPGHPRCIGADHADALLRLTGDRGAQALFAGATVQRLAVDDPGILKDIDRPGDRC
ncbi:nucleotidyltransferase family protein [Stutzerimonas tarimensis]|uniref:NTP transferase domain-containing protein n=1 Tax=Stutzerimonas tarimensis TaxID=1507735 RepID=A0ABV7T791_9GAMM